MAASAPEPLHYGDDSDVEGGEDLDVDEAENSFFPQLNNPTADTLDERWNAYQTPDEGSGTRIWYCHKVLSTWHWACDADGRRRIADSSAQAVQTDAAERHCDASTQTDPSAVVWMMPPPSAGCLAWRLGEGLGPLMPLQPALAAGQPPPPAGPPPQPPPPAGPPPAVGARLPMNLVPKARSF